MVCHFFWLCFGSICWFHSFPHLGFHPGVYLRGFLGPYGSRISTLRCQVLPAKWKKLAAGPFSAWESKISWATKHFCFIHMPTVFLTTSLRRQFCCRKSLTDCQEVLWRCSFKDLQSAPANLPSSGTVFSFCQFSDPLGLRCGKPIPSHRLSCVHKKGAVSERHSWFRHWEAMTKMPCFPTVTGCRPTWQHWTTSSPFLQQSGKQDTRYSGTPKILGI